MNWEAVGAVAEILAAIGGVAAVVYLAVQIRLNTRAVRSSTIDSWVSAISLGNDALASADDFISVATDNYDELDPRQRKIFHRAMAQNMNAMEALYFHYTNGVVDKVFFQNKLDAMKLSFQSRGVRRWWSDRGRNYYDPRFVKYFEALLEQK